jgi:hypothetical protein
MFITLFYLGRNGPATGCLQVVKHVHNMFISGSYVVDNVSILTFCSLNGLVEVFLFAGIFVFR